MLRASVAVGLLSALTLVVGCPAPRRAIDAGSIDAATSDAVIVLPDGAVVRPDAWAPESDAASAPDTGGDVSDAGGSRLAFCQRTCSAPADCASPSPLYDGSHYACDAGVCRWLGCRSDDECRSAFGSTTYACRDVGGLSSCVMTCSAPADCASSAAFDADNYACEGGTCRYLGCNTDDECAGSFGSSAYVCRAVMPPDVGVPIPTAAMNCVLGCASPSDCATSAAFDADNYACTGGACVYEGCNTDDECASTFSGTAWTCR